MSDVSAVNELDPFFRLIDDDRSFSEGIARRFVTPRFGLFYDRNYGLDLRNFISGSMEIRVVEGLIEAEALKDERCLRCTADIEIGDDGDWIIDIRPEKADGPFPLRLSVNELTVELLNADS